MFNVLLIVGLISDWFSQLPFVEKGMLLSNCIKKCARYLKKNHLGIIRDSIPGKLFQQ